VRFGVVDDSRVWLAHVYTVRFGRRIRQSPPPSGEFVGARRRRHKARWVVTSREAMAACELMSPENVTRRSTATIAGKPAVCWQHRLFGKQLVRCNQVNDTKMSIGSAAASLVHEDGWPICEIIGMYFSFVNPGATCDDFTRQLVELYASVNGATDNDDGNGDKRKRFEVVHVVLWSNMTDVLDFEETFRAHVADLPWLAVPNRDYERKVKGTFLLFFCLLRQESVSLGISLGVLLSLSSCCLLSCILLSGLKVSSNNYLNCSLLPWTFEKATSLYSFWKLFRNYRILCMILSAGIAGTFPLSIFASLCCLNRDST